MEKKTVWKCILSKSRSASNFTDNRFTWLEVKQLLMLNNIELRDTDVLEVGYVDGYDHGDEVRDVSYDLKVNRPALETDEEFQKRREAVESIKKESRERRYQNFLALKKEFET